MRIAFLSDIHGVPGRLEAALTKVDAFGAEKIVLLGDLLYHGPRNGVPGFYDPVRVAEMLNARRESILAVRGNCDSEVDQAMLKFPIMAEYAEIFADSHRFFLTHGHRWNEYALPPIGSGDTICHGHTHVPENKTLPCGVRIFNPGSVSLPKGGSAPSFGTWDGCELSVVPV